MEYDEITITTNLDHLWFETNRSSRNLVPDEQSHNSVKSYSSDLDLDGFLSTELRIQLFGSSPRLSSSTQLVY